MSDLAMYNIATTRTCPELAGRPSSSFPRKNVTPYSDTVREPTKWLAARQSRGRGGSHSSTLTPRNPDPVEGPNPPINETNEITQIPESQESQFRQPAEEHTLTPPNADDIDYWLDIYDTSLFEFMCECEHPDFDPCLAAIDEEYFESFTGCTDPDCEVHGDPPDFDLNDYHY